MYMAMQETLPAHVINAGEQNGRLSRMIHFCQIYPHPGKLLIHLQGLVVRGFFLLG